MKLLIKDMYVASRELPTQLGDDLGLSVQVVRELIQMAVDRKLVEALGTSGKAVMELRYSLTDTGRRWATESLEQCRYVGVAPVPIEEFQDRVVSQKITNERIGKDELSKQFGDLVVSDIFLRRIGPAVNSGRALLLYGPPGNGKTSIAERMSRIYADIIYIPHAIEVDGQIIKIYDPSIHKEVKSSHSDDGNNAIRKEALDRRYVACKRPIIITGGELTLEMLDLRYDESAKYYEAPLHMKALGGTFIIDDFGRQLVKPEQLLNRWIVPLESRVDFLKLAHRQDLLDPVRRDRRVLDQPGAERPHGSGLPAPYSLQARDQGAEPRGVSPHLPPDRAAARRRDARRCGDAGDRGAADQQRLPARLLSAPLRGRSGHRRLQISGRSHDLQSGTRARRARQHVCQRHLEPEGHVDRGLVPPRQTLPTLIDGRPWGARCRFANDRLDAGG